MSGVANLCQYARGYFESKTGLVKFGTRYYNPALGRWTQQDPVGGSLGDLNAANWYTYAKDDPVNVVDPSGAFCIPVINVVWYIGFSAYYVNNCAVGMLEALLGGAALIPAATLPAGLYLSEVILAASLSSHGDIYVISKGGTPVAVPAS